MSTILHRRDKWIPWYFVLFFLVIAAVDGVMVTLAVRTQTGIVTEHPYEKGLAYNRVIDAEQKQEALGWKSEIVLTGNTLRFTLRDKNGAPIVVEKATAYFTRPTQSGMDFSSSLKNGQATIDFPAKGLWEVRVEAIAHQRSYQRTKRIVVP